MPPNLGPSAKPASTHPPSSRSITLPLSITPMFASKCNSASVPASSSSSPSTGVYVPVHRRTTSAVQAPQQTYELLCSTPQTPGSRSTPIIYTPEELTALAQSPLVKQLTAMTYTAFRQRLHRGEEGDEVFAEIAMSRRKQRRREYRARKEEVEARHHYHHQELKGVVVQQNWRKMSVDAVSWRAAVLSASAERASDVSNGREQWHGLNT
ncbi:hypothetical protein FB45DRAFT_1024535 [Roridomyces roridus]|uniref:Uncharacterized protein n=1 Tax=Roridomyces roridus TaxID=1738132 RepID=A0AAD7C171_9AGAR|nr:hypothetical protein FB45DRAFT_1024535 [Roridomyces roridus]